MAEPNLSGSDVIVGTPICRCASFALNKFLSNQQEIQHFYPGCRIILATDELDFVAELKKQLNLYDLNGEVIYYKTVKPNYAQNRVWSITCGRKALRQYALSHGAEYLLFLDGDMVFEPSIISIMKGKIQNFDAVSSGYCLPHWGDWGFGTGCLMFNSKTLHKITFRCYEFNNGQTIAEDAVLDLDLFKFRARVNKGVFVSIKHYIDREEYMAIEPQPTGWFRTISNNLLIRYIFIRISIMVKCNVAYKLHAWLHRFPKPPIQTQG